MASLQDNQRHQRHHDLCSCYSLLICCHPFSTTYIFFSKNHQSLISLYITSSLESIFLSHSASLAQNTPLMMSHALIHLPPAHHAHPPSHIHCFIPGSKLTFSTNLFHHSLLAPTWTAFSDYTGPELVCSTVFHFYLIFYFFLFWVVRQTNLVPLELDIGARGQKAPMMGLPDGRKSFKTGLVVQIQYRVDGRTDIHVAVAKTTLCYESRG